MTRSVQEYFRKRKKELFRLLSELIAIRTVNPPGNEVEAARYLEEFCRKEKIRHRRFEKKPGRTNLLLQAGDGRPCLLVACHLDVVPAGEGWKTDPFRAVLKRGRVYGRGAVDNKGQLAASLMTLKYLKRQEEKLEGSFSVLATADEETGSALGLGWLSKSGQIKADAAIVPDCPDNMRGINISEKGAIFLQVSSFGKQAHGSTPEEGVNAIWHMLDFLQNLKKGGLPAGHHPLHSPPTLNLGTIEGGSAVNIVPAKCEARLDFRYLPGQKPEKYLSKVRRAIEQTKRRHPEARFSTDLLSLHYPVEVKRDTPLIKFLKRRTKEVRGIEPKPYGISGSTNVKQLVEAGIEAVGFSPGGKKVPHMSNEWVSLEELVDFATILALVAFDFIGKKI